MLGGLWRRSTLRGLSAPAWGPLGPRSVSTIFALASGRPPCGVAVIRVSGPQALQALVRLCPAGRPPTPRRATLRTLVEPGSGQVLDQGLTLWFPGPQSFTGEDCAEFHVHGGPAVVAGVLRALSGLPNYRPAQAGEFTKRAFQADKLDLTQVEGLGDLISAETEFQRRQACRQMGGHLTQAYSRWRSRLLKLVASLEAYIDFGESEDIEANILTQVAQGVAELSREIQLHLRDARAGERLRHGVHVAIVGDPNVGKSSFMNRLAGRDAAIVSPVAGTTRDVVETCLDLGGYPIVLMDTAGLRTTTSDAIEREGIQRAQAVAQQCDILVYMLDASRPDHLEGVSERLQAFGLDSEKPRVVIANKADLFSPQESSQTQADIHYVSCLNETGLPEALSVLTTQIAVLCSTQGGESPLLTRQRHYQHAENAVEFLDMFLDNQAECIAIASQHLRMAIREIGFLAGKVSSEQILDVIFADFCIGK